MIQLSNKYFISLSNDEQLGMYTHWTRIFLRSGYTQRNKQTIHAHRQRSSSCFVVSIKPKKKKRMRPLGLRNRAWSWIESAIIWIMDACLWRHFIVFVVNNHYFGLLVRKLWPVTTIMIS